MAAYALPSAQFTVAQIIEPCPAPLIPVSGIASVTVVAGGQVCIAYYQSVPAIDGGCERHVCVRLQWPPSLILPASRFLWATLEGIPAIVQQVRMGDMAH